MRGLTGPKSRPRSIEVSRASAGESIADRYAQMQNSLPTFTLFNRTVKTASRTYAGIIDLDTGDYAMASSGGVPGCDTFCGEGNAYHALGQPLNYLISKAWKVERDENGILSAAAKMA